MNMNEDAPGSGSPPAAAARGARSPGPLRRGRSRSRWRSVDAGPLRAARSRRTARRGCATATSSRRRWPARLARITLREGDCGRGRRGGRDADAGAVADARRAHAARAAARAWPRHARLQRRPRAAPHRARRDRACSRRATSCSAARSWPREGFVSPTKLDTDRLAAAGGAARTRRGAAPSATSPATRSSRRAPRCIAVRARRRQAARAFAVRAPVRGRVLRVAPAEREPRCALGAPLLEIGDTARARGRRRTAHHRRAAGPAGQRAW